MSASYSADLQGRDIHLGLSGRRRNLAAGTVWLSIIAISSEALGAVVLLPSIAADFRISAADATWMIRAYQFGILLALLPMASLGDVFGYRRINQIGLAVYGLAAIGCMLAPNFTALIFFRLVQGLGTSGIVSVNSALVRHTFPANRLARALSYNAVIIAIAGSLGPIIASAVIAIGSWRYLFALSGPICILALLLGYRSLPDNLRSRGFETGNALLYSTAVAAVFGSSVAPKLGFGPTVAVSCLVLALGSLGLLVRRSLKSARPLLPVDVLRSSMFSVSIATSISSFAAQTLAFITFPFFMIHQLNRAAIEVGPLLVAWPAAVIVAAPLAGRLADRISTAVLAGCGLAMMAAGLFLLGLTTQSAESQLIGSLVLCGFGFGFFQTPNNHLVITSAPMHRAGAAGGLQAAARHLGQITGAGLAATVFTAFPNQEQVGLVLAGCIATLAAVLSLSRQLLNRRQPPRAVVGLGLTNGDHVL